MFQFYTIKRINSLLFLFAIRFLTIIFLREFFKRTSSVHVLHWYCERVKTYFNKYNSSLLCSKISQWKRNQKKFIINMKKIIMHFLYVIYNRLDSYWVQLLKWNLSYDYVLEYRFSKERAQSASTRCSWKATA